MEEYIDEVEEVVDDEYFGESYDKELAWKEECYNDGLKYNVPIEVDTQEEGIPINWTQLEGIKSLKVDTNLWVL